MEPVVASTSMVPPETVRSPMADWLTSRCASTVRLPVDEITAALMTTSVPTPSAARRTLPLPWASRVWVMVSVPAKVS